MLQRQFFQMLPTDVLSRLRTRTIAPQSRRQFSKRKSLELVIRRLIDGYRKALIAMKYSMLRTENTVRLWIK